MGDLLTITEAAKELRISRTSLYTYMNNKTIKSVWLLGHRLIERAEIYRLIKESRGIDFQKSKSMGRDPRRWAAVGRRNQSKRRQGKNHHETR